MKPVNKVLMNKKTGQLVLCTNQLGSISSSFLVLMHDYYTGCQLEWDSRDYITLGDL